MKLELYYRRILEVHFTACGDICVKKNSDTMHT